MLPCAPETPVNFETKLRFGTLGFTLGRWLSHTSFRYLSLQVSRIVFICAEDGKSNSKQEPFVRRRVGAVPGTVKALSENCDNEEKRTHERDDSHRKRVQYSLDLVGSPVRGVPSINTPLASCTVLKGGKKMYAAGKTNEGCTEMRTTARRVRGG